MARLTYSELLEVLHQIVLAIKDLREQVTFHDDQLLKHRMIETPLKKRAYFDKRLTHLEEQVSGLENYIGNSLKNKEKSTQKRTYVTYK